MTRWLWKDEDSSWFVKSIISSTRKTSNSNKQPN